MKDQGDTLNSRLMATSSLFFKNLSFGNFDQYYVPLWIRPADQNESMNKNLISTCQSIEKFYLYTPVAFRGALIPNFQTRALFNCLLRDMIRSPAMTSGYKICIIYLILEQSDRNTTLIANEGDTQSSIPATTQSTC